MVALGGSLFLGGRKKVGRFSPEPPLVPVIVLCTGKGSSSWLPLELQNEWNYQNQVNTMQTKNVNVTGTRVFSGQVYFRMQTTLGGISTEQFMRTADNGDIHWYNQNTLLDELYIPAEPVLGQVISVSGRQTRQVGSLTDIVETGLCTYFNVLRIDLYENGLPASSENYQKGIGQVYNSANHWNLVSLTLH
jgi:hypothetical protein